MRIGELAKMSQVPASTIRFYEKQGLLPHARRNQSGYRVYDDNAMEVIQFIKIGQMLGFKLHELPGLMRDGTSLDHDALLQKLDEKKTFLDNQITQLQHSSQKIVELKQELTETWSNGNCLCTERLSAIFEGK